MGADKALLALGMVGRWQVFHYIMICALHAFPGTWQFSAVIFIAYAGHEYHCAAKPNMTLEESVPRANDNKTWSKCLQYKGKEHGNETEPCTSWNIDPYPFQWTTVMEWNLVCGKSGYIEISQLMFLGGLCLGCITCVPFSDWFGRRPSFFVCQFLCCLFGICMAFATTPEMLWVTQVLAGMFTMGNDLTGFVLGNELFPADMRVYTAPAMTVIGSFGFMIFAVFAYFIRRWRELQLVISSIPLSVLLYFYFCPESVRWLTVNKRFDEGQKILDVAAKANRLPPVPPEYLTDADHEFAMKSSSQNPTIKSFLSHKKTLMYFGVICFCIFTTGFMLQSISFLTQILPGDLFVNFTVNALLIFPGAVLAMFSMHMFGRRNSLSGFLAMSAVTMGAISLSFFEFLQQINISVILSVFEIKYLLRFPIVPQAHSRKDHPMLVTTFTLFTRFSSQAAWGIQLVYVQEIFPTSIRSRGVGLVALLGFIGFLLSPGALYLARTISLGLPLGISAGLAAVSSILSLLEPETLGRILPTTTEEVLHWPRSLSPKDWKNIKEARRRLWREIRGIECQETDIHGKKTPEEIYEYDKLTVV